MMTFGVKKNIIIMLMNLLIVLSLAGVSAAAEDKSDREYRVGVTMSSFGSVNVNDATAAIKAWASMITKEQSMDVKLEAVLLNGSVEDVKKSFIGGEYDGIGLIAPELLEIDVKPEHVYVGERADGLSIRYIIIAHAKSDISSPGDLKDRKLVTCDNNQMVMSVQWLENVLSEHSVTTGIKRLETAANLSKAILQVFFRQADAAIVTREAFNLACELNPQLKKELKVISESPPLIPVLFILQPSAGQKERMALLEKMILDIDKTASGRQVLTVIQSSSFKKSPLSVMDDTFEILEKYRGRAGSSLVEVH